MNKEPNLTSKKYTNYEYNTETFERKQMIMKKTILITALLLTLLLAACGDQTPEATTVPTEEPTVEEPTLEVEETEEPTEAISVDLNLLTSTTWAWMSFTNPAQQIAIESPLSYTLTFQGDGTLAVLADCNNAFGDYTISGSSLSIQMGPMTLAECPPGSRYNEFITYLGSTAKLFFEDGNLFIDLMADGGTLGFAPADTMAADDGEGAIAEALWANDWQWVGLTTPVEKIEIENPEKYHLTFQDDGLLEIVADCNNAHAEFTVNGNSISIEVGPMTLALCPPDSRSDDFINYLGFAANYFFEDGDLFIDMMADGGTMQFEKFDDSVIDEGIYEDPYYVVAKGDTLYAIGVRFGVPWQDIAAANGITNTLIYVGQHLYIPKPGEVVTPAPDLDATERVEFQPGTITDTRDGIINQGVPKSYILRAQAGQSLTVSTESSGEALVISIGNTNGDLLPLSGTNSQLQNAVQAVLPESGDFIVTVRPVTLPENPQLNFRISFTIQ
jgi:heat shock protein HslJ/LysM repeat protein